MTVTLRPPPRPAAAAAQLEAVPCAVCGGDGYEVVIPSRRDPIAPDRSRRPSSAPPGTSRCRTRWSAAPPAACTTCGRACAGSSSSRATAAARTRTSSPRSRSARRTFRKCLDKIETISRPSGKRVLDVGAAGGSFLAMARERGYEPLGCEPSTWMCQFAREHYGLDLHPGTIFDMPLEPGSIDLLTLWDVIEHTPDPKAVLRARARAAHARAACSPCRGPTTGAWPRALLGSRWPFLLTVHLYYFAPPTMTELLRRTGFRAAGLPQAPADPRARLRGQCARRRTWARLAGLVTRPHSAARPRARSRFAVLGRPDDGRGAGRP